MSRRRIEYHQPAEENLMECEWCGQESIELIPEHLGNPAEEQCINEDCPGDIDEYIAIHGVDLCL